MTIMWFLLSFAFISTEHAASVNELLLAKSKKLPAVSRDDMSIDEEGSETHRPRTHRPRTRGSRRTDRAKGSST